MNISCPKCRRAIPLEDVNVSTDVALCRSCSQTFSFAELAKEQAEPPMDMSRPPTGTWLRQMGGGFEVGATTRSAIAFFLVPFTVLWSGGSLGGIYGTQIYKGALDWKLCLFGLPFLLGSLFLVPFALMCVCGKITVRREGDRGAVFTGIGPIGWTRRFRWSEVKAVRRSLTKWQQNNRSVPQIEIELEAKSLRFGSQLSGPRREFLLRALKQVAGVRTH
ncbi:hypothetical protein LBMAG56_09940 [Verrucomicrobiota bacterium]|nr:hypothetical protein LBMAG56_09940 [Verrucomicrobiota bacterium]